MAQRPQATSPRSSPSGSRNESGLLGEPRVDDLDRRLLEPAIGLGRDELDRQFDMLWRQRRKALLRRRQYEFLRPAKPEREERDHAQGLCLPPFLRTAPIRHQDLDEE